MEVRPLRQEVLHAKDWQLVKPVWQRGENVEQVAEVRVWQLQELRLPRFADNLWQVLAPLTPSLIAVTHKVGGSRVAQW